MQYQKNANCVPQRTKENNLKTPMEPEDIKNSKNPCVSRAKSEASGT